MYSLIKVCQTSSSHRGIYRKTLWFLTKTITLSPCRLYSLSTENFYTTLCKNKTYIYCCKGKFSFTSVVVHYLSFLEQKTSCCCIFLFALLCASPSCHHAAVHNFLLLHFFLFALLCASPSCHHADVHNFLLLCCCCNLHCCVHIHLALHSPRKKINTGCCLFLCTLASHNLQLHSFYFHNALLCNPFIFLLPHIIIHPCALKICCPCFSLCISLHAALHMKKNITFFLLLSIVLTLL